MHIRRRGSERDHGMVGTRLKPRSIAWNSDQETIEVTAWFVPDFNTPANHDWYVHITLEELASALNAAASALGGTDTAKVARALSPSLTSLLRLATEASLHLHSAREAKQEPKDEPQSTKDAS